jgi:hypothetical protein
MNAYQSLIGCSLVQAEISQEEAQLSKYPGKIQKGRIIITKAASWISQKAALCEVVVLYRIIYE